VANEAESALNPERERERERERDWFSFRMAAKGWISIYCKLHIKSMLYKTNQQLETNSKPREMN